MPVLPVSAVVAASGSRPRQLASPLVGVLSGPLSPGVADLLTSCVAVRPALHPGLLGWLTTAGWSSTTHPNRHVVKLPARVVSLEDARLDPFRGVFGNELLASFLSGATPTVIDGEVLGSATRLRISPSRLEVRSTVTHLRFEELLARQTTAVLLVGESSWFPLDALRRSALVVRSDPDNPARAVSVPPSSGVECDPVRESAADALSRVESLHLDHPVALDGDVLDAASMAAAGPADRLGLLSSQDLSVSGLLASGRGAVLASPPGSGKTVIVAAAVGERLADGGVLIAAPTAVLSQWVSELARWAPSRSVGRAASVADVTPMLSRFDIVVASLQVAGSWGLTSRRRIGLLVVDEAALLARASQSSRGLHRLRHAAEAAWALSGSPDERGSRGGVARLLAWARGLPSLPDLSAAEFAPLVVGMGSTEHLPQLQSELLPCPSPVRFEFSSTTGLSGLARVNAVEALRGALAFDEHRRRTATARLAAHVEHGGRALVFSSYSAPLEALVVDLRQRALPARVLPAPADRVERVGVLSAFASGTIPVLCLTPSSQRGVNLQQADLVLHLDLPGSLAELRQRAGRAVRIGSPHREVLELLCALPGSPEEAAARRLLGGQEPGFPD